MRRRGARPAARRASRRTTRRMVNRRRRMRRRMRRRVIIGGMVLVGVGYGAYKLGQNDVDQIEQHTGKKVEDLSEEEMDAAMADLGIEGEEVSDQDIAQLEAADDAAQAPAAPQLFRRLLLPAPPAAPAPAAEPDYLAELQRLAEFKDQGIITEEEFNAKKKQLLGL